MSLRTIDIAIGIVFLFLLLTFVASALLEIISKALNWRAKNLHDAIGVMLADSRLLTPSDVYRNPLVLALSRDACSISRWDVLERMGWREHQRMVPPSYIPPATFSAVVLETVINHAAARSWAETLDHDRKPLYLFPDGAVEAARSVVDWYSIQGERDALLSVLRTALATQGSSIQAVRLAIEKWFNDTMDRASGWYKRRTQSVLLVLGLIIGLGGNVDTIAVVRWLYQSDAARQVTLAAASDYLKQNSPASGGARPGDTISTLATQLSNVDRQIADLQYPIGWRFGNDANKPDISLAQYLIGGLITAIAVSMGSTF